MPRTIESALKQLIENDVNMPADRVSKARGSRDWLLNNIKKFETNEEHLYFEDGFNMQFGSFSRKTKIRPIDDIDLMIGLNGHKLYWDDNVLNYKDCSVHLKYGVDAGLWRNCLNDDNSLNSTKLLNVFKSALFNISHYENADIHRMQQAVTLKLSSYEWNFDLVPCFYTTSGVYLIPNGRGKWMKTDPRKDKELVTSVNQQHSGKFLELVRLMKYWNSKSFTNKPKFNSPYLLEVMLSNYYQRKTSLGNLEKEFEDCLLYVSCYLDFDVQDPKGIEGNINRLTCDERKSLKERMENDLKQIQQANNRSLNSEKFIYWKCVLGKEFPDYGA
ncbi:SMODS domain-containing nucleotidyltransferase [Bisgaard Taxon 46]